MNEDGEFVCEDHKPERTDGQWWAEVDVQPLKCDHCERQACAYVLTEKQ